ncbi:MAG: hypothetical protein ACRDQ1_15330 [Sciscionella sp.]
MRRTTRARAVPRFRALVLFGSLLLLAAACGGSSNPGSTTPTTSPSASPTTSSTTTHLSGPVARQIGNVYAQFFNGQTDAQHKIALVEKGPQFAKTIAAQASSAMAKSTAATVSKVTVTNPTQAKVVYTVSLGGVPVLKDEKGGAIKEGGQWKVSAATFCTLLNLEHSAPAVCKASATGQ